MARIKQETIILVILFGIVFTVSCLIIASIRKEQNVSEQVSAQSHINEYLNGY